MGDRQEREDVYEGKPLSEVTYEDLVGFIALRRAEGEDLDYKQAWDDKIVRTVCAMANTAGGDVLVGIKEERDERSKTNRPDPSDMPGIAKGADLAASVAAKVRSRTRPALVPEVEAFDVPDRPGRAVLAIRVAESADAPHEVRHGPSPEILVRRRDNTESAGIDDVERLLRRRDASRAPVTRETALDFFEDRVARPGKSGNPPVAAVWARPRLAASLRFSLDHSMDEKLEHLFRKHRLGGREPAVQPFASGVAIEGMESGKAVSRVEVHENGTIRGSWALPVVEFEEALAGGWMSPADPDAGSARPWLLFDEMARVMTYAAFFAAAVYGTRRTAVEVEFVFGLHRCQGFRVMVPELLRERPRGVVFDPAPFDAYQGRVPGHPMGNEPTYVSAAVRTTEANSRVVPVREDLLEIVRALSRAVGVSAPDARLEHYLR